MKGQVHGVLPGREPEAFGYGEDQIKAAPGKLIELTRAAFPEEVERPAKRTIEVGEKDRAHMHAETDTHTRTRRTRAQRTQARRHASTHAHAHTCTCGYAHMNKYTACNHAARELNATT